MIARELRKGDFYGRYEVAEIKTDREPFVKFGTLGVLLFDALNRRYSRHTFRPRQEVDFDNLPEWVQG